MRMTMPAENANDSSLITQFTCVANCNPTDLVAPAQVTLQWQTAAGSTAALLSGVGVVPLTSTGTIVTVTETTVFELTVFASATNQVETATTTITVTPDPTTRMVPAGTIVAWAGNADALPAGWLLCDGTVYQSSNYPALATVLGSSYGGTGTTTFGVPNLVGSFIMGATGQSTEAAQTWGPADTHTHPIPAFSGDFQTDTSAPHTHELPNTWYQAAFSSGKYTSIGVQSFSVAGSPTQIDNPAGHSHSVSLSFDAFTSDGTSDGIQPPWFALCYIIKT
ncbi:MAG: tail fiber protein [Mesorhizobium sp.]|nr:MAG: tail fiber protein [Mesorhizobium sp.]